MALNFYLNSISDSNKINVQTNASFTSKIGDFDVGSFVLEWNTTKDKIAPYTKLFIEDTSNSDYWCFVIINDEVEVVHKGSTPIYAHNLTVTQNTYEFTSHQVRNSVFTQPIDKKIFNRALVANSVAKEYDGSSYTYSYTDASEYVSQTSQRVYISKREKIKRVYINIESFSVVCDNVAYTSGNNSVTLRSLLNNYVSNKLQANHTIYRLSFYLTESTSTVTAYKDLTDVSSPGVTELEIANTIQSWLDTYGSGYVGLKILQTYFAVYVDQPQDDISFSDDFTWSTEGEIASINTVQTIIEAYLTIQTYYYSLYDVLNILNKQALKKYIKNQSDVENIYEMPSSGDVYNVLVNTVAPDFTFTNQNLWSCVANVLEYIDAIPTLDENNVLGFEYLNDYSREESTIEKIDTKSSLSFENYTNSLISNYQNARQENAVDYPGFNLFKRTSSKVYGIPSVDDYILNTDKPIDYIDNVYLAFSYSSSSDYDFSIREEGLSSRLPDSGSLTYHFFYGQIPNGKLDIASAVYEQSIYSLLDVGDGTDTDPNQYNSLAYTRESNYIYLGGLNDDTPDGTKREIYKNVVNRIIKNYFGLSSATNNYAASNGGLPSNLYDIRYSIKYHAIFDGRISQESTINKHKGETYVAQQDGGTDLNRMGNNMQGLVAKLGNEVETITIPVTDYGSRLKKGSLWVDDDGKKYIANLVKTTFSTTSDSVMVEAQFSRNFNLLSQFTKIDKQKRFYTINNNLISKGYENLVEYLYFSAEGDLYDESQDTAVSTELIQSVIFYNFKNTTTYAADFALMTTFENEDDESAATTYIYLPLHTYGAGNSLCFEMGYDSPINAADRLVSSGSLVNTIRNESVLYTAKSGFADIVFLNIYSTNPNLISSYTANFPESIYFANTSTVIAQVLNYYYYKKPNEIFHLNYSLAFMPNPDEEIFFGDELINHNIIIRNSQNRNLSKKFYLYAGDTLYSIIDNKLIGTETNYGEISNISVAYDATSPGVTGELEFISANTVASAKSWCIADEEGNIYFAVNQTITNKKYFRLYFCTRRQRIE